MKDYPIFISSADSYADLWPVFFDLFKLHWPDYNGTIYLNTQEKKIQREGLNIKCTRVGRLANFGMTFQAGLDKVNSDNIMLMMIDYLFMEKVNAEKLDEYFNYFLLHNLDTLTLLYQDGIGLLKPTGHKDIGMVIAPSKSIFSYQIAFWKKDTLHQMILPHESRWTSEFYGTRRANGKKIHIAHLLKGIELPISYDPKGCLRQGKWFDDTVRYLQSINYQYDYTKRGHFTLMPPTIKYRLITRWILIKDGLKGSYWSLLRKNIKPKRS